MKRKLFLLLVIFSSATIAADEINFTFFPPPITVLDVIEGQPYESSRVSFNKVAIEIVGQTFNATDIGWTVRAGNDDVVGFIGQVHVGKISNETTIGKNVGSLVGFEFINRYGGGVSLSAKVDILSLAGC